MNLMRDLRTALTPKPGQAQKAWITGRLCQRMPWLGRLVCGPRR